eukprot:TRINITY_DN11874_c0_g2_i1.p2 TRINITY_DN11874_c0_g2~~TRINITY_DN11874_c0_g2_i1.p2  ORF type:complete len:266 (+),score=67.78 TRINITY_DN11874_c0_g2_i1:113-799(+)
MQPKAMVNDMDEQRRDPHDGQLYTKREFKTQYGGYAEWDAAEAGPWNPNGNGALHGIVKHWVPDKGFGFITGDDGTEIFVHHSDIGGRSLRQGGKLTYDIAVMPNGKTKAVNISGDVGPRLQAFGGSGAQGPGGGKGMPSQALVPAGAGGKGKGKGKGGFLAGGAFSPFPERATAVPVGRVHTTADVHVHIPPGYRPGGTVRFTLLGQEFEVQPPPGLFPGQEFVVDL